MKHSMTRIVAGAIAALSATASAQAVPPASDLEPGLTYRLYAIGRPMQQLAPLAPEQRPNRDTRIDAVDFADDAAFHGPADFFVVEILGYLSVETGGDYAFRLVSDDGSRLVLDGQTIITHDGLHPATGMDGSTKLEPGLHPLHIQMFESAGGAALQLLWKPPGASEFTLVPASAFRVERDAPRITSPGRKVVLDGRENLRPGHGMPLDGAHPGWVVEDLRPEGFEPLVGAMAFLPDGRLALTSFNPLNDGVLHDAPRGSLWIVDNMIGGDPSSVSPTKIAEGLYDPTGMAVVDGDIYVAEKFSIIRFRDADNNGSFETRETFCDIPCDNYHHFTFGLLPHDGYLYGTLSTSIYFGNTITADNVVGDVVALNGPNPHGRGTCFRVNLDTAEIEYLAGGFRTPNGIGLGPDDDIFVSDNQGAFLPASKLIHMQPGRFYGHDNGRQISDRYPQGGNPALFRERGESPPAVWLPQNECANSPTIPLLINQGPFAGQMYLGELTAGGIRRIFLEQVNGEYQGAVFRFTQGFEAGVNRLLEGPDGCLYIGGTGSGGNWNWRGTTTGLQRLRPTGKTAFEYQSISATSDGFVVEFTRPVPRDWLESPANYLITQWRYQSTPDYGGPKLDNATLTVQRAIPAPDRKSVRLVIPGIKPGHVVHFMTDPRADDGAQMWSTEAWYTLNAIPE